MAVVLEADAALKAFVETSELYLGRQQEQLADRLFTTSPRDAGKLCYSRSLDRYSSLLDEAASGEQDKGTAAVVSKQQDKSTSNAGATVKFSLPDKSKFDFQKASIEVTEEVVPSKLSECIVPVKMLSLKVFLPKKGNYEPSCVDVRVQETENVEAVILAALRSYNSSTKLSALATDSLRPYQLCTAEDDGSPEEFGTLRRDQSAARLGDTFGLMIKEAMRPTTVDRPPLVVRLPNNTKTMVPFQPGLKVGDLIRKICDKRGMNAADFHITAASKSTGLMRDGLASDLPLEDVQDCEFQLCPNVSEFDAPSVSSSILTEHDALKYKVFDVTYGKKKNYALGISDEHIRILKKKGHQIISSISSKQREVRNTSDVQSVAAGDRSKQFTITWKDGKQDMFESSSRDEIVQKLSYILNR